MDVNNPSWMWYTGNPYGNRWSATELKPPLRLKWKKKLTGSSHDGTPVGQGDIFAVGVGGKHVEGWSLENGHRKWRVPKVRNETIVSCLGKWVFTYRYSERVGKDKLKIIDLCTGKVTREKTGIIDVLPVGASEDFVVLKDWPHGIELLDSRTLKTVDKRPVLTMGGLVRNDLMLGRRSPKSSKGPYRGADLFGYDLAKGKELFRLPPKEAGNENPRCLTDDVIIAEYRTNNEPSHLTVRSSATGKRLWRSCDFEQKYGGGVTVAVLRDRLIFWHSRRKGPGRESLLCCLDLYSGKVLWERKSLDLWGHSAPIIMGETLWWMEPKRIDKWKTVRRIISVSTKSGRRTYASEMEWGQDGFEPIAAINGHLFFRFEKTLYCFTGPDTPTANPLTT